jgi:DNA uptake protein ComE-like DNA-binding protein
VQPWSARQRVAVMLIAGGIVAFAMGRYAFNRTYISDPQPLHPLKENELADKIDPNTADAASLAVLPLIGEKRAEEIIAFRERYTASHHGKPAFQEPNDLLQIRGIGVTTVEQLTPYLIFPGDPSTQPTR